MTRFTLRFFGALALLPYVYEEVEKDRRALPQALLVVALSSLATGAAFFRDWGPRGLAAGVAGGILGWLVWTWLTYFIGTRWLPEPQTEADWGQLLRTTGFAAAPGVLRVFGAIPQAREAVLLLTTAWMLVAFVIAVRQALDYKQTWRAVAVCLAGALIYAGALFIVPQACPLGEPR
jgi:hypothetical protein